MYKCAHCHSSDTQVVADYYACTKCGEMTRFDGTPIAPEARLEDRNMNDVEPSEYAPHGSPAGPAATTEGPPEDTDPPVVDRHDVMNTTETSGLSN